MADVLLVTGASSDVGRALLARLASRDAVIYAHHAGGGDKLRSQIAGLTGPARIIPVQADFRVPSEVEALVDTVRQGHGTPNKIVHLSALPLALRRFSQFDWNDLEADLAVSVRSITTILRAFLPELAKQGVPGRVVILLSSVTVGEPPKGLAAYTLVKFMLLGLVRALATEYADKRIGVNAISPYTMDTPFLARVPHKFAELTAGQNPMGRNARPEDVAPVLELLLSNEAEFVTGVNLPIAGGAAF